MSWIDRINNVVLKVTTGDGSIFTPLYKSAQRSRNMNASVFNFSNIEGSLVRRGRAESMKYPFEFHFTGKDNLDEAERFNIASLDRKPWQITHPEYGDLLVQPITLNFNNNNQNDTVVTGELFETIADTFPESSIDVKAEVQEAAENAIDNLVENFNLESPSTKLAVTASSAINDAYNRFKLSAVTDIDLQQVQNKYNDAISALTNVTQDPLTFIRRAAELYRTPTKFYQRVQDRITVLKEAYNDLKLSIGSGSDNQSKLFFEVTAGVLNSAISETSVVETQDVADEQQIEDNSIVDYKTRSEVIAVVDDIKSQLDDYLNTLGDYQNNIDATSYTPQQSSTNSVKDAVNKASGQLLQLAVQSRQERKYTLPKDIGIIMLVHRLLGTTEDNQIQLFAENNNILMNEWLQIPKGREVIYYL